MLDMQGVSAHARAHRLAAACACVAALALLGPAAASAAVTCEYNSGAEVLSINLGAANDGAIISVNGSEIRVNATVGPLTCANGPATTANTEFVSVGGSGGATSTFVSLIEPAKLSSAGVGVLLAAGDSLLLNGSAAADHFVIGNGGVDSDGDGDKDISFIAKPSAIQAGGGTGEDTISAQGGNGTGAALTGSFAEFAGDTENDTLDGGEGGDVLKGGDGGDLVRGHGGDDRLIPDFLGNGDDTVDGGPGSDTFGLEFVAPNPLSLDLGKATPQVTGYGKDTVTAVENAEGSEFADALVGDAGPNQLSGGSGDDLIEGKGGADMLSGDSGTDTLSYADAPSGVVANLQTGSASGGDGTDTLSQLENLIGSAFADALTASNADNAILAGGGADTVQALGGQDLVLVRDGLADNASCGDGIDRAVSDRRSLDTVQADCEVVDALPDPAGPPAIAPDTTLKLVLSGARKQRLVEQRAVLVRLRCPLEACTTVSKAAGRLAKVKPVKKRLAAGRAKALKLHLKRAQVEAIEAALAAGRKPKLKVTVRATDAAGNPAKGVLVVTAKR
jgi:hypothetical protein